MQEHSKRIGLLVGAESTFPPALLSEINRRQAGVTAELVKVGEIQLGQPASYHIILDRISHQIPFYRSYWNSCVLEGRSGQPRKSKSSWSESVNRVIIGVQPP